MCYQFGEQIWSLPMETFSIRDLRERSGELVRQAEVMASAVVMLSGEKNRFSPGRRSCW